MERIAITKSVGSNGVNLAQDVAAITAALVAVGPTRGGTRGPAASLTELTQAIQNFQEHERRFQRLKIVDGRVDPNGSTLRCINNCLAGNGPALQPPPGAGGGTLTFLQGRPDLSRTVIDCTAKSPVESSLTSDYLFDWTKVVGQGKIYYFQMTDDVVPKWYGVLVPAGTTSFNRIHLFFHPTPNQAGYNPATYFSLGNWSNILRYLWNPMGAAFCAAATGRVLIMPLMTDSVAMTCGILAGRWEELFSQMLSMVQADEGAALGARVQITSVVVSSFSSGIIFSHHFRQLGGLGSRLSGVIDFDGTYSTNKAYSAAITAPAGRIVRAYQMPVSANMITPLAAQNLFPLPKQRMKPPFDKKTPNEIHGGIPQFMMYIAARRLG